MYPNKNYLSFCTEINCGVPPNMRDATTTFNGTEFGDTANYTCDVGFQFPSPTSVVVVQCTDTGRWTTAPETCGGGRVSFFFFFPWFLAARHIVCSSRSTSRVHPSAVLSHSRLFSPNLGCSLPLSAVLSHSRLFSPTLGCSLPLSAVLSQSRLFSPNLGCSLPLSAVLSHSRLFTLICPFNIFSQHWPSILISVFLFSIHHPLLSSSFITFILPTVPSSSPPYLHPPHRSFMLPTVPSSSPPYLHPPHRSFILPTVPSSSPPYLHPPHCTFILRCFFIPTSSLNSPTFLPSFRFTLYIKDTFVYSAVSNTWDCS